MYTAWYELIPAPESVITSLAPLPTLTNPAFNLAKVNGAPAGLKLAQKIQMTNASGGIIGRASAPDSGHDGFRSCTYTATCAAPVAN